MIWKSLPALLITVLSCASAQAAVSLGSPFSDDMVVQRGKDIAVWGKAGEGEAVSVEFRGAKVSTAAKEGKWIVHIPSSEAGGPFEMIVKGENEIRLKNVLV